MQSIKRSISQLPVKANLAGELLPRQLLVEIFGFERVVIEHHFGVIKYEPDEVCVKAHKSVVHIQGNSMLLAIMTKEQLVITGHIAGVFLEKEL